MEDKYARDCKHISELGNYHFSVRRWFDRQRRLHPERRDLVVACAIVISHVETRVRRVDTSYEILKRVVAAWEPHAAPVPPMPRRTFSELLGSYKADPVIARYRHRPLMWEFGAVGRFRLDLWAVGMREPDLTRFVLDYARATSGYTSNSSSNSPKEL